MIRLIAKLDERLKRHRVEKERAEYRTGYTNVMFLYCHDKMPINLLMKTIANDMVVNNKVPEALYQGAKDAIMFISQMKRQDNEHPQA